VRQRRGAAGSGLDTTIKYLRRPTSGTAGNGQSAAIKYIRRKTSGATGNGLGTTPPAHAEIMRRRRINC
jgi:hypothetical protein